MGTPIKVIRIVLVFFAVIGLSLPGWALDDAILAVVNDEVITLKDLQNYIRQTQVSLVAEGVEQEQSEALMAELERDGINRLVEDKLILSRANEIGITVRDKLVDERLAEIRQKYGSEQAMVDALVQNGATLTDLKNKIVDQLKIKFIVDHEVKSKIFVNPQEVTQFYDQNQSHFQKGERVNLDSVYIAFMDDKEIARTRAHEALGLAKDGRDFAEVAKQYSDTPSLGVVERGQLLPAIEEAVFNLGEGGVSPLIEVDTGIYIFKLKGRIPAQTADLKEVKDQIFTFLYRKKFKERLEQWLVKLKKKAYVEIKP
jgi:parvulin-like peptidyl-prolyl isomerase